MPNMFRRSVDTIRSAPLGVSYILESVSAPFAYGVAHSAISNEAFNYIDPLLLAPSSCITVVMGALLIRRQLRLKHRLEDNIEKRGFSVREFALTTDEWCGRQTAQVVCRNADVLPEYKQLCKERSETARLKWLPNI